MSHLRPRTRSELVEAELQASQNRVAGKLGGALGRSNNQKHQKLSAAKRGANGDDVRLGVENGEIINFFFVHHSFITFF